MVHFLTPRESLPYAQDYLDRADLGGLGDCTGYEDILHSTVFSPGLYVFTGINRLGPGLAELLSELYGQLHRGTGFAPLNHPLKTLRRYELLQALHRAGMNDFRAFGAWEDLSNVRFPVFVRPREQDGGVPTLLYSLLEVERAIGRELLEGWSLRDILVIEFENTADETGLFRKYSAYVVGPRVVPVSLDIGSEWVMRSGAAHRTREAAEEEMRFAQEKPHQDQLARIFSIAQTQFGRIDYSVKEGRVQTWEINTLPLLRRPLDASPVPEENRALREPQRTLFKAAFAAAWGDLLKSVPQGRPFQVSFSKDILARAGAELAFRGATTEPISVLFPRIRRFLRPLKPFLKPFAARTLHPVLGRRARRSVGH